MVCERNTFIVVVGNIELRRAQLVLAISTGCFIHLKTAGRRTTTGKLRTVRLLFFKRRNNIRNAR